MYKVIKNARYGFYENDYIPCGEYDYCKYCNKKNKYPCASAFDKFMKKEGL